MPTRVLIIGGYGNFGSYITRRLAADRDLQLIIAGRSPEKAAAFATQLPAAHAPETVALDIHHALPAALAAIRPAITIHTSGPFQAQDYRVASACIEAGSHYIDLADGRAFVNGIAALDRAARNAGMLVVSGASSVPGLTAALVDHYRKEFAVLERLDYGITTAQRTNRGLATTAAILSYTGKPFTTLRDGGMQRVYGWQDLRHRRYPELGGRWLANCDIPDLALFPDRYPGLRTQRFQAGLEIPLLHLGLWLLSGVVRAGLLRHPERLARTLLRASFLFDALGSDNSALHMQLDGPGTNGKPLGIRFELTARGGDGPYIPCIPAILLTRKLAAGTLAVRGARPCLDLFTLDEYLEALRGLRITWQAVRH